MKYKVIVTWKNSTDEHTGLSLDDARAIEDMYIDNPKVLAVKIERDYGV